MGGAGPYIDFNPEEYEERYKHTGLSPLPEDVLGVVWARAHLWLMTSVRDVLQSDGWALDQGDFHGEVSNLNLPSLPLYVLTSNIPSAVHDPKKTRRSQDYRLPLSPKDG
jgi:hypothetical protein